MIARVSGVLAERAGDTIVVETDGGVGYALTVPAGVAPPSQAFKTPEEAVQSLAEAIDKPDEARAEAMFGKGWRELLSSGDAEADREDALKVRAMILEKVDFEDLEGNRKAVLLGNVSYRCGRPLEGDAKACKATNAPEADKYIRHQYREGWKL